MKKSIFFILLLMVISIAGYFVYPYYNIYLIKDKPTFKNMNNDVILKLPHDKQLRIINLSDYLLKEKVIDNKEDFEKLAIHKKIADKVVPYKKIKLLKTWNTYNALLNNLNYAILHHKEIVNIVFNNVRSVNDIAGKVAKFIDADSSELSEVFNNDSIINYYGFNKETWPTFFLPNTYECYKDISPKDFYTGNG